MSETIDELLAISTLSFPKGFATDLNLDRSARTQAPLIKPASLQAWLLNDWSITAYGILTNLDYFSQGTGIGKDNRKYNGIGYSCLPPQDVWTKCFPAVQERILSKAKCLIATSKDNPELGLAYLLYEPGENQFPAIIHFCTTKIDLRKQGVMKALLKQANIKHADTFIHSYPTPLIKKLKLRNAVYVPFWMLP